MKKRTFLATVAAAAMATTAFAGSHGDGPVKAGFVYVGPIGDGGWTYEHHQGLLAVEEAFGDKVETVYQESVPEGADAERAMTQMALQGADIIFTTSFGYMDPTINVAQKFPKVKFEHATGYKRADNVSTYNSKFHEGRAVLGTISGKMSKSGTLGYLGSFKVPEVVLGVNSFLLSAQKQNPNATLKLVMIDSWFDPPKEAAATETLINLGCDIVTTHTDSPAALNGTNRYVGYHLGG